MKIKNTNKDGGELKEREINVCSFSIFYILLLLNLHTIALSSFFLSY